MKLKSLALAAAIVLSTTGIALTSTAAHAQAAKEQFFPVLSYRTGRTRRTGCRGRTASSIT